MYLHTSFPVVHGEGEAVEGHRLWFSTDGPQGFKRAIRHTILLVPTSRAATTAVRFAGTGRILGATP